MYGVTTISNLSDKSEEKKFVSLSSFPSHTHIKAVWSMYMHAKITELPLNPTSLKKYHCTS